MENFLKNLVEIFPPVQICIFKNLYKRLNLNSFLSLNKTSASIKTSCLNQIYFSFRYIAGGYAGGYKNPREIQKTLWKSRGNFFIWLNLIWIALNWILVELEINWIAFIFWFALIWIESGFYQNKKKNFHEFSQKIFGNSRGKGFNFLVIVNLAK